MVDPSQSEYFCRGRTFFCNFLEQVLAFFCSFFMKELQSQDAFVWGMVESAQTSVSVPILSLTA